MQAGYHLPSKRQDYYFIKSHGGPVYPPWKQTECFHIIWKVFQFVTDDALEDGD